MRVLIVDDEIGLAESIRDGLVAEGFTVELAHDGEAGLAAAQASEFDAVILDIMLPKRNGYRVCADLRAAGNSTPILMLTAKQGDLDEAEALDTGADDFLSKPFSFVVLLARLRALGRRRNAQSSDLSRVQRGDLIVDIQQRRVWRGETEIHLTARELDLLDILTRRSPDPVPKLELLSLVWGAAFDGDPNVVEVYVGYLRRKIDAPFERASLQTVRGIGYRLDADR